MSDATIDLNSAIFTKTAAGQQEVQTRTLGLGLMARRLLILIDGKRTGQELGPMLAGQDLAGLVGQLLASGCVSLVKAPRETPSAQSPAQNLAATTPNGVAATTALADLPDASKRTAKEAEMARNFMINTVNSAFGQHMCLSLIESISGCETTAQLRQVYPSWLQTMSANRSVTKELPGLVDKLFRVL